VSVATSTAIGIAGAIGAVGAVGGAALSAGAAGNAANAQAGAANNAANLQFQLGQENLGFQEQQYRNALGLAEPYYNTGTQSLGTLAQLMGLNPTAGNTSVFQNPFGTPQQPTGNLSGGGFPDLGLNTSPDLMTARGGMSRAAMDGGSFFPDANTFGNPTNGQPVPPGAIQANGQPGMATVPAPGAATAPGNATGTNLPVGYLNQTFDQTFTPPDAVTEQNDPGYKFRLNLGDQLLENSAASRGGILSGGTAQAEQQFGQDYASNEYGNVYNRALQNYNTAFNTFNANRTNLFNRYASMAGLGQATAQQLGNVGLQTGANVSNDLLGTGAQVGQNINNAGAARASGYVGAANAYSGAAGGIGNLAMLYAMMQNQNGGGGGFGAPVQSSTNFYG